MPSIAQKYLFVGSRAADFVAQWIQILAKAMVKGILGSFDSSPTSGQGRSLPGIVTGNLLLLFIQSRQLFS